MLVHVYGDISEGDEPLAIKYKWDAAKEVFVIVSVVAAKPYATSYNCAKAEKDGDGIAQVICYVETLADLAGLKAESRRAVVEEQRSWLKQRNDKCGSDKRWVEGLTEAYETRIAALKKKLEERKK